MILSESIESYQCNKKTYFKNDFDVIDKFEDIFWLSFCYYIVSISNPFLNYYDARHKQKM